MNASYCTTASFEVSLKDKDLLNESLLHKRHLTTLLVIGLVHHLTTPVIHSLLLQIELPESLPDCQAVGHDTVFLFTLPSMDLEECPDAFTNMASSGCFNLTLRAMLEEPLHLGTIGRCTLGRFAGGGM
jgi:hypothetical protein